MLRCRALFSRSPWHKVCTCLGLPSDLLGTEARCNLSPRTLACTSICDRCQLRCTRLRSCTACWRILWTCHSWFLRSHLHICISTYHQLDDDNHRCQNMSGLHKGLSHIHHQRKSPFYYNRNYACRQWLNRSHHSCTACYRSQLLCRSSPLPSRAHIRTLSCHSRRQQP